MMRPPLGGDKDASHVDSQSMLKLVFRDLSDQPEVDDRGVVDKNIDTTVVHYTMRVVEQRIRVIRLWPVPWRSNNEIAVTPFGGRHMPQDPRIRIIEISEYASLRDLDQRCVSKLIDVLSRALTQSDTAKGMH